MDLITLLKTFSTGDWILVAVGVLSIVQIAPIKIDPWTWLAKRIGSALTGDLSKKIDALSEKVDKLEAKEDRRDTVNKRVRILHFEDELQEGRHHSKDSFDQVLSDITDYEQYCKVNPTFKNEQTAATVAHIRKVYNDRLERRDFL